MKNDLLINAEESYQQAEQRATEYFKELCGQVEKATYIPTLVKDIQTWKQNHIRHHSILSLFSRRKGKPDTGSYHNYIQWLNYTGKLDHYLDRSISYIFMRDLGKALNSPATQTRIRRVVNTLKDRLIQSTAATGNDQVDPFSMAGLYRLSQKENIESTMIWLLDKLKTVSVNIPTGMETEHAQRKLIKIIAGVIMQEIEEMGDVSPQERAERLDRAIRLGYSYGLTYPFIDDLLDANILSDQETRQYSNLIRTTLITGDVPELGEWDGDNKELITYIHSELRAAFEYIKTQQRSEIMMQFLNQAYVFFNAQEVDRDKDLSSPNYTNDELYIPVILKSSSSRLIVRSLIGAEEDKGIDDRTFFYGIYNQLADDFTDMFGDLEEGAVTPYTYYMKYHKQRPDLINPFELYWTVISNLIHNVYQSDEKTKEVILDRAINSLKRFKERWGVKRYNEVMALFASGFPKLNTILQKMVQKAGDVDFFDKLLRDHMISNLKNDRREQEKFLDIIESVRNYINPLLTIPKNNNTSMLNEPIIDAANYSLEGGGKRLRPIMTWVMGIDGYGLKESAIVPLLRSLEYMHTASLIFDDLPSQDNSDFRRGRPTLHRVYNIAMAELTGLFLTQKATEEQASLIEFDSKTVLQLVQYSAKVTAEMCNGQAMDLDSKGRSLTLDQLNVLCFYKTGIAFEASLIMPAILAQAEESEMETLKIYAQHAGIAFQIKDDLLDVEGELHLLGKPVGKDVENHSSTFVSILGLEDARKAMWEHYCLAMEALQQVPRNTSFLKQLLNYIVNRDH